MNILNLILGIVVLFLGRRLFWLFVAIVGFIAGFQYAGQLLNIESQALIWVIAILAGIIGAVLAIFLQRFAAGLAGFLAGGSLAVELLPMLNAGTGEFAWLPYIIGGIIGAILAFILFDWALIVISALLGANLIVQAVNLEGTLALLALVILFAIGVLAQAAMLRETAPPAAPRA